MLKNYKSQKNEKVEKNPKMKNCFKIVQKSFKMKKMFNFPNS